MSEHSDVLVIGGGVIGVCTAYSLAERGVQVRLIERGEICSGSSHGNAGWVFPNHSMPIPAPGVIRESLRWLANPAGPLYIKPRANLALLRWLWEFRAACNDRAMRRSYALRRELSVASLDRYAQLAALPGFEFGFQQHGLLQAFRSAKGLAGAEHELAVNASLGGVGRIISCAEMRERIPLLSPDLVGGALLPNDAHITPGDFVRGLSRLAQGQGVDVRTETEVLELESRAGQTARVATTRGEFSADEIVLCAGAWSPELAGPLGLRLPVEAAKGYSITTRRPPEFGELPVILAEAKVGVTPMGPHLRFAGTLELAGLDLRVNRRRVRAIEEAVPQYLPGLPKSDVVEVWRGLRPLTPDDLPIIGRPRKSRGLVIATGHGMKGMSQGPITGELVAQLIAGEPTSFDLEAFSPDRFA